MKSVQILEFLAFAALSTARPLDSRHISNLVNREVPQEHSHEKILTSVASSLNLNNPAGIKDPVFALLGNAAAAAGAGSITNLDCLQQDVADQAFTNAKAAGDVDGMTNALIFRTLERNTGSVGLKSVLCNETATNPEIAALSQHQDPASDGAAATNKQIALNLAVQIASIGGNPQQAIDSGTFAPGQIGDPTAAGNTCDDQNDAEGCIFTQDLLVPDVTADEINAAVASASAAPATATAPTAAAVNTAASTATENVAAAVPTGTVSGDLGSCAGGSPLIVFGPGFDGRTEDSFEPEDEATFNHGSADNIAIIADFICGQLSSKCKASQDVVDQCNAGKTAATASGVSGQAAADAFNSAFS
ncbi:hypothetical protein DTO164E3_7227 [Paecilomyces variotii]|nr:hypothetical protein DTO164E3_7227 [Paecilomyces variotii]KAJ9198212.1 hypothetical protein DTO032I3_5628 [Paecilomyces variotii]KAJ9274898.1 hypothetical protein DTO021D3_8256 [Paecilomyces variotii]KAJ9344662.1 hypothetical protein DTO027B6_2844 [Paecilomyces variotii]KAJ9362539.1 hypothetical protein DTO027B9_216 [Paecilomyces variotii]